MKAIKGTIGFIGSGNMAEAFIGGMLKAGVTQPSQIRISDLEAERMMELTEKYGVGKAQSNQMLYAASDIVILAVKPQVLPSVLGELGESVREHIGTLKLIISIAAGVPLKKMEALLYEGLKEEDRKNLPLIRVMPNTPAQVLKGMSAMSLNAWVRSNEKETAERILASIGTVIQVEENQLDAVTAISGSGPAYVFYFIEAMVEAGESLGLRATEAYQMALATFDGAVQLIKERQETPEVLRRQVTSPGGTTEAAITEMASREVKQSILKGITAAFDRSKELSR